MELFVNRIYKGLTTGYHMEDGHIWCIYYGKNDVLKCDITQAVFLKHAIYVWLVK